MPTPGAAQGNDRLASCQSPLVSDAIRLSITGLVRSNRVPDRATPSSNDCATARSASALGGPAPHWTSWTYKPGGLRDTQTEHSATDTTTVYGYPAVNATGAGQPHTLTSVTVGGTTSKSYTYDEQGNTTKRYGPTGIAQSLVWDIEGELTRLTEGTKATDYLYDANGELLIRRGPVSTVLYLNGQEIHYDTAAKTFTAQRYYPAGDATAIRTETSLTWMVDNHHGTASMTVDATTQAVTHRYTKPFGETRGATPSAWPDDKGFLGKPHRRRHRTHPHRRSRVRPGHRTLPLRRPRPRSRGP
ncbi:hypothetical protein ACFWDQ_41595 [Streptomyces sp. NPDC060053]|uniref:hypothetical protein n=1 Tax=Streptomyces sp. NPDC060053 TaxID=3347047 RepID=UPI0036BEAD88